jgi:hypothetical protein
MHNTIRELSCEEVDATAGGNVEPHLSGNGPIVIPIGFKPQPDPWRFDPEPAPWRVGL